VAVHATSPLGEEPAAGSAPGGPWLAARGLGLAIGGVQILADVSVSLEQGEMLGVIGPNGAGKTTLFNVLSGVLRPTAGAVWFKGRDITADSAIRRARAGIGRTFQTSSVFPALSVLENVRLAAQARIGASLSVLRRPRASDEASEFAVACLADAGLAQRASRPAGELAHGEKRKLEIALLLATKPDVLLLDEPMAGVGSADVPELGELIRRVHRERGRTVLMVEHHLDVLLGLVDRVAVLHHGRLLACDTPAVVMQDADVQAAYLGESV
jgi:branched-chain amino acid transport system ATP-binding protein